MSILVQPLTFPILAPMIVGLVCLLLPRSLDRVRGAVAVAGTAVTALFTWKLFVAVRHNAGFVQECCPWFSLRIDHLSSFVLLGVAVFGFLSALYSTGYMKGKDRLPEYYAYLMWTVGIACGAVLANDLILLLVFWGLLGLTLYVMIGIAGPDASAAAKKSFVIIGGSDCALLLGVAIIFVLAGTTSISQIAAKPIGFQSGINYVAFLCLAVGALAKAGAMPLHSWVPDCGEKAPISVTAFLPASLDKLLGIYLLARTTLDLFKANSIVNLLLMVVGAGTVVCAVMMAMVQHDLKRLLSYHAVSQVGYMVLGIGTGTPVGIAGGLFHMLNNAIYKSCLFFGAGAVEQKAGTTDLDRLGGLARVMPITLGSFVVAALAISGVPPLNGFTSKWMVYQGIIDGGRLTGDHLWIVWLTAAMFGSALTLASFVKVLHAVFLRKPSSKKSHRETGEVGYAMWVPPVVLAVLCVLFGVFADALPLSNMIFPAIRAKVVLLGQWSAAPATLMLIVAFLVGLLVYFLTTTRTVRESETYIGGEHMNEVYISGEKPGVDARDVEVTGVDFYRTIEDLFPAVYRQAGKKLFDLYDVGSKTVFYFTEALRSAHSGLLPMYLTWVLAGLLALLWLLTSGSEWI